MTPIFSMLAVALQLPALSGGSDSWGGWRGANGSGVAHGSPPIEWSETKNVRWKTAVPGTGLSSPVVWGERVFLTTAIGTGKKEDGAAGARGEGPRAGRGAERDVALEEQHFVVLALERATGAVQWQKTVATAVPHQRTHAYGSYASPTIATDGELVIASFGSYGIHALRLTGEVVWQVDLGDMNIKNAFGEGSSPILHGELVLVCWEHDGDSFLIALDRKTGQERWRAPRPRGASWTTPIVVRAGGSEQIVVGGAETAGYDPLTGRELWHQGEPTGHGRIASPVAIGELVVFAAGGRKGNEVRGLRALPAGREGEEREPLVWSSQTAAPRVSSPIAYEGKVYMLKQDSAILTVLDPRTGKVEYGPERLKCVADVYASLVAAGGCLYVTGRDGTVEVLSAWPKIESLAVNHLEDGFDASPAVAGDELFLRGHANAYCIAEK